MSNLINCVVDTHNKQEREKLAKFVSEKTKTKIVIDSFNGFQLMAIHNENLGNVGVIVARNMINKEKFIHFSSYEQFEEYHIKKEIGEARFEIYKKYGLRPTIVRKTGASVSIIIKKHQSK